MAQVTDKFDAYFIEMQTLLVSFRLYTMYTNNNQEFATRQKTLCFG